MKYMRKEPYSVIAWGWFYFLLILLLLPAFFVGLVQTFMQGSYFLFTAFVIMILALALSWLHEFSRAKYMTKSRLEQRVRYIKTAIIPQFDSITEGPCPTPSTLFDLLAYRDLDFVESFGNTDFRYGDLRYTVYRRTRGGEVATEHRYMSMLELTLPRELPNMLFDSRMNNKKFKYLVDKDQIDRLEGGFDDVFLTYFPMHYEIDARSIIAPDVMAPMLDAQQFDMEIVGNKLYLFGAMVADEDVATMIRQGLRIRDALADHVPAYRDERLGDATNRTDVAMIGKNLQESMTPYLLGLVFLIPAFLYFALLVLLGRDLSFSAFASIFILGVFIFVSIQSCVEISQAKKQKEKLYEAYLQSKPVNTLDK